VRCQDDDVASTPALVTSTECAPEDFAAARNAGANFYIVKPVKGETLAALARLICGMPP